MYSHSRFHVDRISNLTMVANNVHDSTSRDRFNYKTAMRGFFKGHCKTLPPSRHHKSTHQNHALAGTEHNPPPVSETKAAFLAAYPRPLPGLYDTIIQELLVVQHLIRFQKRYQYSSVRLYLARSAEKLAMLSTDGCVMHSADSEHNDRSACFSGRTVSAELRLQIKSHPQSKSWYYHDYHVLI